MATGEHEIEDNKNEKENKMKRIIIEDLNQEQTITNEGMKMVYGGMRTFSLFSRSEDRVCYLSYDDSNAEDVGELLCYDLPEK